MGANPTPAADVRALIEDIRERHGEYYFSRIEPMGNYCNSCGHEWPCDAYLAAALEQAVTALEFYGDESKWQDDGPIGTRMGRFEIFDRAGPPAARGWIGG